MLGQSNIQIIISARDDASKVFRKMQGNMKGYGKQMTKVGKQMTMGLTMPIAALGAIAVKSGADFDQAMTKSLAIMSTTIEQEKEMKKVARDVAKATAFSHKEAADAYFYLASAGLGANEAIAAMPAVAEFAQAGAFDLALATDLLTDAQSALGLTIRDDAIKNMKNMIKVSDVLVKANTLANATVEQFSTALTTEAGAAMKSFGMDLEEGVAVLAAFADQGVKGQIAGSGFSRILRLMTKAANDNQKEMDALGITVYDTEGNLRNMADIIADLETGLSGMSDKQRTMALESIGFSARVQGIILPLLGTSDAVRQYEENLREAGKTTKNVADKQLESFTNQMIIIKNQLVDVGITVADMLMPHIKNLAEWIKKITVKFQALSPRTQKIILVVAGLVAAIGPLLMVLGMVAQGLALIGPILAFLVSPIGLVVLAITGLVIAGIYLYKNWDTVKEKLRVIWEKIKGIFKKAIDWIKNYGLYFLGPAGIVANLIIKNWDNIKEKTREFVESVIDAWKNLFENIGFLVGMIIKTVSEMPGKIKAILDLVSGYIWTKFEEIKNYLFIKVPEIINEVVNWFGELPGRVRDKITEMITAIINKIRELPDKIRNAISGVKDAITQPFKDAKSWISNFRLPSISLPSIGTSFMSGLRSALPSRQFGGYIPETGPYLLHKGENVVSASSRRNAGGGITVNINGGMYLSERVAEEIGDTIIEKLKNQLRL